jgi:hypothetical protein
MQAFLGELVALQPLFEERVAAAWAPKGIKPR